MAMITLLGMLVMLAARMTSAHPIYGLTSFMQEDPYTMPRDLENRGFKRGFWDKRTSEEVEDDEGFGGYPIPVQWNKRNYQEKRGFGSMMPAYLVHMYRPDIPVLPPNSLFSPTRPSSERGEKKIPPLKDALANGKRADILKIWYKIYKAQLTKNQQECR